MDNNLNTTFDTNSSETAGESECVSNSIFTFQFYTWGIVGNCVSVYGIIGNILAIIVLSHRQMRNSTSYYLISLAVYDTVVLLLMSLFLAVPTIYPEKGILEDYYFAYPYIHPYVYPAALIAQTGAVYTTLAFTVERYIAVCNPLHAVNTCTMTRTKKVIFAIFIVSVFYNIPRFFEYKTAHVWREDLNRSIPTIELTDIGSNQVFNEIYFIYAYLLIMFLLPFSFLAILNILLIRAVNKARTLRNSLTSSSRKDTNLTITLIAVINVFLGCQLPALVDNITVTVFGADVLECSVEFVRFTTVSNLLVVVNSAINFMLYCIISKRFRSVFLKMFRLQKKKPKFKFTHHHRLNKSESRL